MRDIFPRYISNTQRIKDVNKARYFYYYKKDYVIIDYLKKTEFILYTISIRRPIVVNNLKSSNDVNEYNRFSSSTFNLEN